MKADKQDILALIKALQKLDPVGNLSLITRLKRKYSL